MLSADEIEDTPNCLAETVLEIPVEIEVSLLCAVEINADIAVDMDATEVTRATVAEEIPEDSVMSVACNVDAAVDNEVETDTTPLFLAVTLDVNDDSVAVMVAYSCGPASNAVPISNRVSSEEGAAPTNAVIPFIT